MTGTTPPLVPTVSFEFEGENYTAVADHMTIVRYERAADRSFGYALLHLERVAKIGEMPKFSELGYLVEAMLGEHHPDIGLETAIRMAADPSVMAQLGDALGQAMPVKKETARPLAKAATKPPTKSGRKKSGIGKRSSPAG